MLVERLSSPRLSKDGLLVVSRSGRSVEAISTRYIILKEKRSQPMSDFFKPSGKAKI